jgi:hypothetical protein
MKLWEASFRPSSRAAIRRGVSWCGARGAVEHSTACDTRESVW